MGQLTLLDFLNVGGKGRETAGGRAGGETKREETPGPPTAERTRAGESELDISKIKITDIMKALGTLDISDPHVAVELGLKYADLVISKSLKGLSIKQVFNEAEFLEMLGNEDYKAGWWKAHDVSWAGSKVERILKRMKQYKLGAVVAGHGRPWNYIPVLFEEMNAVTHIAGIVARGAGDLWAEVHEDGTFAGTAMFLMNTWRMETYFKGCAWYVEKEGEKWNGVAVCGRGILGMPYVQAMTIRARYCAGIKSIGIGTCRTELEKIASAEDFVDLLPEDMVWDPVELLRDEELFSTRVVKSKDKLRSRALELAEDEINKIIERGTTFILR